MLDKKRKTKTKSRTKKSIEIQPEKYPLLVRLKRGRIIPVFLGFVVFFLAISAGYQLGKELLAIGLAEIEQEKSQHLDETCRRMEELEKQAQGLKEKISVWQEQKEQPNYESEKELLLELREFEKKNEELQSDYLHYQNDLSIVLFGRWQKSKSDVLHEEIRNLSLYGTGLARTIERIIWQEKELTKGQQNFLKVEFEELGYKLKDIRKNSNVCLAKNQ